MSISKQSVVTFCLESLYRCRGESKFYIIHYSWMCHVRSVSLFISPFIYSHFLSVLWLFCDVLCLFFYVLSLLCPVQAVLVPCSVSVLRHLVVVVSLINLFIVLILSSKEEKVVTNTFPILKQQKDSLVASAVLLNGSGPCSNNKNSRKCCL